MPDPMPPPEVSVARHAVALGHRHRALMITGQARRAEAAINGGAHVSTGRCSPTPSCPSTFIERVMSAAALAPELAAVTDRIIERGRSAVGGRISILMRGASAIRASTGLSSMRQTSRLCRHREQRDWRDGRAMNTHRFINSNITLSARALLSPTNSGTDEGIRSRSALPLVMSAACS
jgi:hypothetical protein